MTGFVSRLAPHLQRFLDHKRGLGYTYRNEEWLLHKLDDLARESGSRRPIITESFVRHFVAHGAAGSRTHRLTVARQFSRFVVDEMRRAFVPQRSFLGVRRRQPAIRVLSREEASRFAGVCASLADRVTVRPRWLVHGTALWTLLMTGMRRGEALGLTDDDVDLVANVLTIRKGKFGKSRLVPIAPDVGRRLKRYRKSRAERVAPIRPAGPFFPDAEGVKACNPRYLHDSFLQVLRLAGIPRTGRGQGPRLHDLRHSFACLRLLAWYEEGANLEAKLPLLATYLGHVGLKSTQVYLHMTKDFVGEIVKRQHMRFGDLITDEVPS
jgi:integrase/recombinase XerD